MYSSGLRDYACCSGVGSSGSRGSQVEGPDGVGFRDEGFGCVARRASAMLI